MRFLIFSSFQHTKVISIFKRGRCPDRGSVLFLSVFKYFIYEKSKWEQTYPKFLQIGIFVPKKIALDYVCLLQALNMVKKTPV